jgi:hypothetical protein
MVLKLSPRNALFYGSFVKKFWGMDFHGNESFGDTSSRYPRIYYVMPIILYMYFRKLMYNPIQLETFSNKYLQQST